MLNIDKVQLIEGVTVYGDDDAYDTFYLLPQQPRYRLDDQGRPVFKFIKYKFPIDREDGKKGGGFLLFDAEFVVPEDKLPAIKSTLQSQVRQEANRRGHDPVPDVKVGTITYTKGETKLNLLNQNEDLVEQVFNPGVPSLFGRNITSFGAELTPEGAALCMEALQGRGGLVQVVYMLQFMAKLPPIEVNAWFNAHQFYSFYQEIDTEWRLWDEDEYRETVREKMIASEAMGVELDAGGVTDQKIVTSVRDWALRTLEEHIENKMIEQITPVPDDQRTVPDGIEDVTRDITKTSISSFRLHYKESQTVEWKVNPQGTLPNITNLTDADGEPIRWEDYAVEADLDDEFFKQLRVNAQVNADFGKLPIHSVEVKLRYRGRPMRNLGDGPEGEVALTNATDLARFGTFVEDDDWRYTYSYQVNYKGSSRTFQSDEIETDESTLTIGVDDVGILRVDVRAGDINWTEVASAQVQFTYEDEDGGVAPIEEQFVLTQENASHEILHVIFEPMRKAYRYRVKYVMKDGKEYASDEQTGRAQNLFIDDPFSGTKEITVIAAGDLQERIANIFVDLRYEDATNDYTITKSLALNANTPFGKWAFPVVSETLGAVTYNGTVVLKSGAALPIEPTLATSGTIMVPKAPIDHMQVDVITDLLSFDALKLVRLALRYTDDANFASLSQDFVFTANNRTQQSWKVPIFDPAKRSYVWEAIYFMANDERRTVGPTETSDRTLILEAPV